MDELVKRLKNCATQAAPCLTCDMTDDGSCIETLMKQAADAIEELQQIAGHYEETAKDYFKDVCYYLERVPKWIPVTERLPEIEEDVLIAATVHTKKGDVRAVTGDFINTAGQWNGASCSWRYEVTHWMPLPQPPKEG